MSKGLRFVTIIVSMIAAATAVKLVCEIFSTCMQKYYLVDGGEQNL